MPKGVCRPLFVVKHNIYYQNIKTTNDIYFNHLTLALARKIYYIDEALVVYRYCRKDSLTLQRGQSLKNIICAYTLLLKQFNEEKILCSTSGFEFRCP